MTKAKAKANMYNSYEVGEDLAKDGIWIDYDEEGFKIKIAALGSVNKESQTFMSRERKRLGIKDDIGRRVKSANEGKYELLIMNVMSQCLIKDWRVEDVDGKWVQGLHSREGDILPFNKENVFAALKALPVLREDLVGQCTDYGLYLAKELADEAKN